jgi:hypothetical protein
VSGALGIQNMKSGGQGTWLNTEGARRQFWITWGAIAAARRLLGGGTPRARVNSARLPLDAGDGVKIDSKSR